MATYNPNFQRRPEQPPRLHPKKVRGGLKLTEGVGGALPWASSWAAQRWIRIVESVDDGQNLVEGLQYAKLGQTKSLGVDTGGLAASIQGRADRAYTTRITFETFSDDQWHRVIKAMSEGAVYAAKLLSGELPPNIEDLFIPLGLKLFPVEVSELKVSCTCRRAWAAGASPASAPMSAPMSGAAPTAEAAPEPEAGEAATDPAANPTPPPPPPPPPQAEDRPDRWCKHACCAAYLFAERLTSDPFLMFRIRGMAGGELLDRLRHMRAVGQQGSGLYVGRVPGVSDVETTGLEASLETFWDLGPQLADLETHIGAPPITHPLLRRLGPSPFTNSTFPLVGLLASCYDSISADVLKRAEELAGGEEAEEAPPEDAGDDES